MKETFVRLIKTKKFWTILLWATLTLFMAYFTEQIVEIIVANHGGFVLTLRSSQERAEEILGGGCICLIPSVYLLIVFGKKLVNVCRPNPRPFTPMERKKWWCLNLIAIIALVGVAYMYTRARTEWFYGLAHEEVWPVRKLRTYIIWMMVLETNALFLINHWWHGIKAFIYRKRKQSLKIRKVFTPREQEKMMGLFDKLFHKKTQSADAATNQTTEPAENPAAESETKQAETLTAAPVKESEAKPVDKTAEESAQEPAASPAGELTEKPAEKPVEPVPATKTPEPEREDKIQQQNSAPETEQKPRIFTGEDKNKMLATNCSKMLADRLTQPLARYGNDGISFRYYKDDSPEGSEKDNRVLLKVDKDSKDEVTLQIGVSRRGTDRLYSNYLFEAGKTQDEVKTWLENADICVPVILSSAKDLSRRVDEYWD